MDTTTAKGTEMITKAQLTERTRGKGGSVIRLATPHPAYGAVVVVKDLMTRKNYNRPERIGVGPADRGVAFSVALADVAEVVSP